MQYFKLSNILWIAFLQVGLSAAFAQWVTVDIDTVTKVPGEYMTFHQSIAVDNEGTVYAMWRHRFRNPTRNYIEFSFKPKGGVWSEPVVVAESYRVAAMVVDPRIGVSHIFMRDWDNEFRVSSLCHKRISSAGMETEIIAMDSLRVSPHSAFVDQSGFLHVTWVTEASLRTFRIAYLTNKNGDWQKEIIESIDAGGFVDIGPRVVLTPQNEVIIAYVNPSFGGANAYWLSKRYEGNYEMNCIPFSGNYFGEVFVDVAVDASSGLHFVVSGWEGEDLNGKNYFFFGSPKGNWQGPEELPNSRGPLSVSIQVDSVGSPHVIWERRSGSFASGQTYYSSKDHNGIWYSQLIMDIGEREPVNPSFVLDAEGNGHLLLTQWIKSDSWHIVYLRSQGLITGVESTNPKSEIVNAFELVQNYPTPFNASTRISYQINIPGKVRMEIFNLAGELVEILANSVQPAGEYVLFWDGKDRFGADVSSGIYFYKIHFTALQGAIGGVRVKKTLKLK